MTEINGYFSAAEGELALPEFRACQPWIGGDLQTIRSSVVKKPSAPKVSDRLLVELFDGSGALNCAVGDPIAEPASGKPAVLLVHGLGGHEESAYMMRTANQYQRNGWRTYRMNYRGVGRSRKTSSVPYSAGLTDDIRAVCQAITAREGRAPFVIGFSLGGQMLLRTLGEDSAGAAAYCKAAASVSAPLDLEQSVRQLEKRRNFLYQSYLVRQMRRDLRSGFGDRVDMIATIRAIDDQLIAPTFGFSGAEDYYHHVACGPLIDNIGVPTLMLHADDDPWIPAELYRAQQDRTSSTPIIVHLTNGGGHVGFIDKVLGDTYIYAVTLKFCSFVDSTDL